MTFLLNTLPCESAQCQGAQRRFRLGRTGVLSCEVCFGAAPPEVLAATVPKPPAEPRITLDTFGEPVGGFSWGRS